MKDDKKKIVVVGVLALVVVAVGAFQFSSMSAEPPAKKQEQVATTEGQEPAQGSEDKQFEPLNKLVAQALPTRDPFRMGSLVQDQPVEPAPQPVQEPVRQQKPAAPMQRRPASGLQGEIPPFNVGLAPGAQLPGAGGEVIPFQAENAFNYELAGVMVGERPVAVFKDEKGGQRLVPVGGSLDGDSRVTSITRGKVTVRHKGKTITLTMGGTASAN
jgi:hypothetical protein